MRSHRTSAGWLLARPRRGPFAARRPHPLVSLVSRFLVAQAGACAAISVGYSRRHLPWLLLTLAIAVAICGLAALVRSGSHAAWLQGSAAGS
jgi:hypothetical protein